ncbi:glycoside hydrolase superfamily [Rhexocercosporidium sp. MPI-PUGE-AT-0058]|nr:glycoside hydrolase superfamily [Rhexocercosporidium sp. MPI-PUGE-AT-0058]
MVLIRQNQNPMDIDQVISQTSVKEKLSLTAGKDFWHTTPLPRFSVPSVKCSDGPNSVRGSKFFDSVPGLCIPCGSGLGATWNKPLLQSAGVLLSQECKVKGVHAWLGPTMSMRRYPLNARIVEGVRSGGSAAVLKHFVANDQETEKRSVDIVMSDRALREIYLLPFSWLLGTGNPRFGAYSTEPAFAAGLDLEMPGPSLHRSITAQLVISTGKLQMKDVDAAVTNVLRFVQKLSKQEVASEEGTRDFPEDRAMNHQLVTESVVLLRNDGRILQLSLDCESLALIGPIASLHSYYTTSAIRGYYFANSPWHRGEVSSGCYKHLLLPVLNKSNALNANGQPGATIEFFHEPYSSPDRIAFDKTTVTETAYQLMDYKHAQNGESFYISMRGSFVLGYSATYEFSMASFGVLDLYIDGKFVIDNSTLGRREGRAYTFRMEAGSASTSKLLGGLVDLPGGACGLGACLKLDPEEGLSKRREGDYEKEDRDRKTMGMPEGYDALTSAVFAVQPSAIIVTQAGAPISMPWRTEAQSMIHSWYGGNEIGHALTDIIFGKANPSGTLPMTFPDRLEHTASFLTFGSDNGKARYDEEIFVGYKYHDVIGRGIAFPFGHGLSYTAFTLRDIKVTPEEIRGEVVQLYISVTRESSLFKRPVKELKGFEKITLEPQELPTVTIQIDKYSTSLWDEKRDAWDCKEGQYTASVFGGDNWLQGTFEMAETTYWKMAETTYWNGL